MKRPALVISLLIILIFLTFAAGVLLDDENHTYIPLLLRTRQHEMYLPPFSPMPTFDPYPAPTTTSEIAVPTLPAEIAP